MYEKIAKVNVKTTFFYFICLSIWFCIFFKTDNQMSLLALPTNNYVINYVIQIHNVSASGSGDIYHKKVKYI